MTKYMMTPRDKSRSLCWPYALACILSIHPSKVPVFSKRKQGHQIDETREWLKEKFNKSIVFVPINCFAEASKYHRNNERGGPSGYTILAYSTSDPDIDHVVIAKDGKYYYDPNDEVAYQDLQTPIGFYVIYDL